ncbi:hypothetical protein EMN47_15375 [Prolixibacteraceae bacterium JC049]|nr:hypothetical protein [Prolixibacteraceae bacterium JC049]
MKTEERLEQFILKHRDEMDCFEPSDKVWEQIANDKPVRKLWHKSWMWRAAVVLLLVGVGSGVYLGLLRNDYGGLKGKVSDAQLNELIETEAFYAQKVSQSMVEIKKCSKMNPDLTSEVEDDLKELTTYYRELKRDLKENIANKEVIEAMIQNHRYRLKIVEVVLAQMDC